MIRKQEAGEYLNAVLLAGLADSDAQPDKLEHARGCRQDDLWLVSYEANHCICVHSWRGGGGTSRKTKQKKTTVVQKTARFETKGFQEKKKNS